MKPPSRAFLEQADNPNRLMSLWEIMEQYKVHDLMEMVVSLTCAIRDLNTADQLQQNFLDDEYMVNLSKVLEAIVILSKNFNADHTLINQVSTLQSSIQEKKADRRPAVLHARLEPILAAIQENLGHRIFMYLPADDARYWDNATLMGEGFLASFPKQAVLEMREAGNCLAVKRYTACIFHGTRIAEHGLRMLARRVKVKLTSKGGPIPIEAGTWQDVITACKNKILESRKLSPGARKDAMLNFYSRAADHCEYMKDIWRNNISHTKKLFFRRDQAVYALTQVRGFVELLAGGVHGKPKKLKDTK